MLTYLLSYDMVMRAVEFEWSEYVEKCRSSREAEDNIMDAT